jgi:hypothetical protein
MSGVDVGERVEIPADIRELIEASRKTAHHNAYQWEGWQEATLREVWPDRSKLGLTVRAIVAILSSRGRAVCENTVRRKAFEMGL